MPATGRVAFILKGYPRLSETFIAQEIAALEARGLAIDIVSLRHPTDRLRHPVHDAIKAPLRYLPEYLKDEPARVWRAFLHCRGLPGFNIAFASWRRDWRRDRTSNRVRRFGQAMVLAAELPKDTTWLHAHFIHTPASVARYAALLTGLPWSVSAHARDIWTSPDWEKAEKLADCRWAVTCTAANAAHLGALAPAGRVELIYHGLDLSRFDPPPARAANSTPVILSVGRLVPKKGYSDLLEALALLPTGLPWRFVHIGGGPLKDGLRAEAARLGIASRINWLGAQSQGEVIQHYRSSDLFVLACKIDHDGDRDGLPNVLVEAQSQGLACISTRVSAIPELIDEGATGLLVEPGSATQLAQAITTLLRDPAQAAALGTAGARRVRATFSMTGGIDRLAAKFGLV